MKLPLAVLLLSGLSLSVAQGYGQQGYVGQGPVTRKIMKHRLGQQQQPQPQPVPVRDSPRAETPVDRFNFIDIDLLQLAAESMEGNIVLSPASVKTTLSMIWEGSDGQTAKEIGLALRLSGHRHKQADQLHQFQQNLTARSESGPQHSQRSSTLEVASQLFVSDRVAISQDYNDTLHNYHALARTVNMSDTQQTSAAINQWVNNATHGLVPSLVQPDSLSESAIMMLANAIYFRGTWQTAFDPKQTKSACFARNSDALCPSMVTMMETMGTFRSKLIQELDSTLIELPYDDGRYAMLILLPERVDGMWQLVRDLAHANLLHVLNGELEESEYIVNIPKFTIEFNTDLVPFLQKLKVVDVFTPAANLTRMVKPSYGTKAAPAVSKVFHKAKVTVDERGAVAAGATGALVVPLMGGPQPRFRADHPFLFFIRDMRTGGFLFAGRVSEP